MGKHQHQPELINPFLKALEQTGVKQAELFARYRKMQDASAALDLSAPVDLGMLLEIAAQLSGDPCLALRLGRKIDVFSAGTFGFALMTCATFRDTIRLMLGYQKVLAPGPHWVATHRADGMLLTANMKRRSTAQRQLVTELSISMSLAHGEYLVSGPLHGLEIALNYPAPEHVDCYREFFTTPFVFGSEHTQVWMSEHLLSRPVKTAKPADHEWYLQRCEEIQSAMDAVAQTTAVVRRLLLRSAGAFLGIAQVAEALHVSERTLRRRLKAESTSFRAVLDDVKNALAQKYLTRTALDVVEIATLLGYTETENFYRAFARWNAMTPAEFRRQQN